MSRPASNVGHYWVSYIFALLPPKMVTHPALNGSESFPVDVVYNDKRNQSGSIPLF